MTCSTTRDRLIHSERNMQVINTHIFTDTHLILETRPQICLPEVDEPFWEEGDTCPEKPRVWVGKTNTP